MAMKNIVIRLAMKGKRRRGKDNIKCDEATSQVATNGKRRSTPTRRMTQVHIIKMHILEGGPAKITRSRNATRSRKRSLH
jgi:hypothetical protein